ncbi:hypothetical protein MPER_08045, partial [Moniliophthora perniciosa FA553]
YESEAYDYPVQIQESIAELSTSIGAGITNFAATNLKGTNIPAPSPVAPKEAQHKTLPHALGRAATTAAKALQDANVSSDDKLGKGLALYAAGVRQNFCCASPSGCCHPDQLSSPMAADSKLPRSIVAIEGTSKLSGRLELDAEKQTLKNANPSRQEQARLEVENAEDDLVQKTEVAITLMKTVLENPEPLKNLNELAKAQLMFFAAAAESLSGVQGEIEELSVAAEGEYR